MRSRLRPCCRKGHGDGDVLRQVAGYYHETLKASPEALRYLEARGLRHPEMIDRFRLGFANRTLGYRLPDKNRKTPVENSPFCRSKDSGVTTNYFFDVSTDPSTGAPTEA